jgi:hypothetical protein
MSALTTRCTLTADPRSGSVPSLRSAAGERKCWADKSREWRWQGTWRGRPRSAKREVGKVAAACYAER